MLMDMEPSASDASADVLVFLILLSEPRIMEETGELEILEVLTIDSLRESEVRRTSEY